MSRRVGVGALLLLAATARGEDWGKVDEALREFLAENRVPGAAVAVAREGKVVHERGFGQASVGSRFRIASLSKPITAVAILQLVEREKVGLDEPVVTYLPGEVRDERWKRITVRHLLTRTGGFDRGASYDPMFRVGMIGARGPGDVVRFMMGQRLDFAPGEKYVYSNFGYCALGRVIERVSGRGYEEYVREEVFKPLGIEGMRVGEAAGEVRYYSAKGPVSIDVSIMDAHGGWVGSAGEVLRFATGVGRVLKAESVKEMWRRPAIEGVAEGPAYYGLGWQVRELGRGRINVWHTGLLDGTSALMVRRWDGLDWVVLMNTDIAADGKRDLWAKVDGLMHRAVDGAIGREKVESRK